MLSTKFPAKKTGFSLIELSIVLVVIGILITGIIGGISLVRNATIRAAMGESRAYTVAATSFYNQYDALPGDYKGAIGNSGGITTTTQGDNDGIIEFVNGNGATATKCAEGLVAWQHLKNSGMITDSVYATPTSVDVTASTPRVQTPGSTIPNSKVKSAGWIFDSISTDSFVILTGALAATTPAGSGITTPATVVGILSAVDALAIDTKIDDGKANAGIVRATGLTGLTGCSSTSTYTTVTAGTPCALAFQVSKI